MVEPARFTEAMRRWAGDGPRRAYADEVATVYRRYREGLDAAGLVDEDLFAWRALNELREKPLRWRGTPVFVYGFDDFDALQLDALETLSGRCGADVVVSLPFEPGREAFKAVAESHGRLVELADEQVELEPLDDHYAPARARPCTTSSAGCSPPTSRSGSIPAKPCACTRPAASAPRWSWWARRCWGCCARAPGRATLRWCSATRATTPRWSSRSSTPTRSRSRSTAPCRCARRRWGGACWPCCAARCWRARPTIC